MCAHAHSHSAAGCSHTGSWHTGGSTAHLTSACAGLRLGASPPATTPCEAGRCAFGGNPHRTRPKDVHTLVRVLQPSALSRTRTSIAPVETLAPTQGSRPLLPTARGRPHCFLSRWIYRIRAFPRNGVIRHATFCVWLVSLSSILIRRWIIFPIYRENHLAPPSNLLMMRVTSIDFLTFNPALISAVSALYTCGAPFFNTLLNSACQYFL